MHELVSDLASTGLDACTVNNALNVVQLAALVAILRWLRSGTGGAYTSPAAGEKSQHGLGESGVGERSQAPRDGNQSVRRRE
jgi:hypothetical protein